MINKFKILFFSITLFHIISIFYINISFFTGYSDQLDLPNRSRIQIGIIKKTITKMPIHLQEVINGYVSFTGLTAYCFFSPNPPADYSITIQQKDTNNRVTIGYMEASNFELLNRYTTAINFVKNVENDTLKEFCMRSIAARTHEKYPQTSQITLFGSEYIVPPMAEYKKGIKPAFKKHEPYEFQVSK